MKKDIFINGHKVLAWFRRSGKSIPILGSKLFLERKNGMLVKKHTMYTPKEKNEMPETRRQAEQPKKEQVYLYRNFESKTHSEIEVDLKEFKARFNFTPEIIGEQTVDNASEEFIVAKQMIQDIGGRMELLSTGKEINCDYLWDDGRWELKTKHVANCKTIYNEIRHGIKQIENGINPKGLIIDIRENKNSFDDIRGAVRKGITSQRENYLLTVVYITDKGYKIYDFPKKQQ